MNIDDIVRLPNAGPVLLALHRWLQRNAIQDRTAFDLFEALLRLPEVDTKAEAYLSMLLRDDGTAPAAISLLKTMHDLDRKEAVARAAGGRVVFPPEALEEFERMCRQLGITGRRK